MAEKYVKFNDIIDTLEHEWGYEGMREDLEKLTTADVVEVVRCKNCIARIGNIEPFVCTRNNIIVYGNCYCAFGIRTPQKEG